MDVTARSQTPPPTRYCIQVSNIIQNEYGSNNKTVIAIVVKVCARIYMLQILYSICVNK